MSICIIAYCILFSIRDNIFFENMLFFIVSTELCKISYIWMFIVIIIIALSFYLGSNNIAVNHKWKTIPWYQLYLQYWGIVLDVYKPILWKQTYLLLSFIEYSPVLNINQKPLIYDLLFVLFKVFNNIGILVLLLTSI